jgi:hypothetical protein
LFSFGLKYAGMIDFGGILPSRSNRLACGNSQPRDTPSAFRGLADAHACGERVNQRVITVVDWRVHG